VGFDLVKCGMCGKAAVIVEGHRHVCEGCRDGERVLYDLVKTFIIENPSSNHTMQKIAASLKVKESQVKHLIDSGFFKLTLTGIQLYDGLEDML